MATITVNELAATLKSDPRTTRKFLRSVTPREGQPGKGGRWAIEKKSVRSLTSQFTKWTAEQDAAKAARAEQAAKDATDSAPEVTDEAPEDEVATFEAEGGLDSEDIESDDDEVDDLPMPKHDD